MAWIRENWVALALPAGVLILAIGASSLAGPKVREGEAAANFSLPVLAGPGAEEGDRITLEAYRGEVLVLDFWASWCGPCAQSVPILNRIDRLDGVHVVGVNTENLNVERLRAAHARLQAGFPSVQERNGELSHVYHVDQLPTTVVIDPEGSVARIGIGIPNEGELRSLIGELRSTR